MSNVVKYTLRLNWKKEDERKIISFLNNLYKDIYPTKASYIKDAIKYHINHIMEEEILDAKHLKEKGDESPFITREEYEKDKKDFQNSVQCSIYENILKVISSTFLLNNNMGNSQEKGQTWSQGSQHQELNNVEVDLTQYEDIMRDISAWADD